MSLDLYYIPISPPCRAVMLTAEAIGVPLNLKSVNLLAGEHLSLEYEQLNPQKIVPFLVDGDYKLGESRAIMSYLVDQYGKNPRLNPQNAAGRALVNQRLHFDIGTLFKAVAAYYCPVVFKGADSFDPEQYKKLVSAFEIFEKLLEGQDYVIGRSLTIADLSLAATVSTAEVFGFPLSDYKNVTRWMDKIKNSAPGYRQANGEGLEMLKKMFTDAMQKINNNADAE